MMDTLKAINERLVANPYLCGKTMSIGDIIVFNELSQFFEMCDIKLNVGEVATHDFLVKWFNRMLADEAVAKLDKDMKDTLAKTKKTKPT